MMTLEVQKAAVRSLGLVLVLCRKMAHEGRVSDVVVVLDVAEYLSGLIVADVDRAAEFRRQLVSLVDRFQDMSIALEKFDSAGAG